MTNNGFTAWFESREANKALRCDNIFDKLETLERSEIYDFVESMMLVAWCAGITHTVNSLR